MRLFSEKVTPTYTRSAVNILTVEDFQEIFYDVYELVINKKKFIAEKVTEYKGAPVVEIPVIVEGVEETLSFVLAKGKFEVLVGRSTGNIPVEENYQTPRTIRYSDKGNTVEEIVYDSSESLTSEIKSTKDQLHKYEENAKLEGRINRHIADCKQELYDVIEEKYDDSILTIEKANVELRSELQESLSDATNQLQASITLAESKIKKFYDEKIALLEESLVENKPYFLDLVRSSKQSVLKETESIKNNASQLISENNFTKNGVDLKGIKSELEKLIGTRFSNEMASLKRLIELSSGGGSVAKQFAAGGTMDGDLTVVGLISAQNLTITGTISTTMLEALSANIRYLDINTYELSGFHSTGDVHIDGNLTVSKTITAQNLAVAGTLSTTMLEAMSANITYIDIKQYELSGFDVKGDVDIDGSLTIHNILSVADIIYDKAGNSNNWNNVYSSVVSTSANWNSVFSTVCALSTSWEESAEIIPTITNYLSTNNVVLSSTTIAGTLQVNDNVGVKTSIPNKTLTVNGEISATSDITTSGKFYGDGSSITNVVVTGRTIYVDANAGTDTRTSLSKYSAGTPFATIGAAVAASSTTDTVYVRAGNYTISSQINLNGKGNIFFETGTNITISTGVVAFSLTAAETKIINGFANYTVSGAGTGILVQSSGALNQTTFVCETIIDPNPIPTATGRLFDISGGLLFIRFYVIFTGAATGFYITGSGGLLANIGCYSITCNQVLYADTTATINYDIWSVTGFSADGTIKVLNHSSYSTRGVNLNNNLGGPCINFAYTSSGGSPVLRNFRATTSGTGILINTTSGTRDIFMDQIKINATTSLSANNPTTVYSTTTYSNVIPHTNITVDGQYNVVSKIF